MADSDLTAAVMHLIECGEAQHLARVLAESFAREAAAPTRDQLAAAAMQGLLAGQYDRTIGGPPKDRNSILVAHTYRIADAMLAQRLDDSGTSLLDRIRRVEAARSTLRERPAHSWNRIVDLCREAGIEGQELFDLAIGATGKTIATTYDEEDMPKIEAAIAARKSNPK